MQVAALHSTASSSESDTASITQLQDTPLLQQQSAQVVQQQPAQEGMSSLHSQVLFQLPPHGQPLPNLPRFRPRKAESKPVPLQAALQLIKVSNGNVHLAADNNLTQARLFTRIRGQGGVAASQ